MNEHSIFIDEQEWESSDPVIPSEVMDAEAVLIIGHRGGHPLRLSP